MRLLRLDLWHCVCCILNNNHDFRDPDRVRYTDHCFPYIPHLLILTEVQRARAHRLHRRGQLSHFRHEGSPERALPVHHRHPGRQLRRNRASLPRLPADLGGRLALRRPLLASDRLGSRLRPHHPLRHVPPKDSCDRLVFKAKSHQQNHCSESFRLSLQITQIFFARNSEINTERREMLLTTHDFLLFTWTQVVNVFHKFSFAH